MTTPLPGETVDVRPGEELEPRALGVWLGAHVPGFDSTLHPVMVRQFPGGHSNLTYLVRCGDDELVLRRPPVGSPVKGAHDMEREYRVLSRLAGHYPPAPRVVALCTDRAVLGAPFYVMERVRGVILRRPTAGETLSPESARRRGEQLVDGLVALHHLDIHALGLEDLGRPEGYVERQIDGWNRRWEAARTDDIRSIEEAFAWLHHRLERSTGLADATVLHNDYKFDNVVFAPDDGPIVAVLDWEMATIGTPLLDLGTTLAYWIDPDDEPALQRLPSGPTAAPGGLRRRDVVERYASRSARDVGQVLFAYVYGLLKVAVIAQQIYARYRRGLTQDERFATLREGVRVLGRTAERAMSHGRIDNLGG